MAVPLRSRHHLAAVLCTGAALLAPGPAAQAALPTPPASAQPAPATPGRTFSLRPIARGLGGALWVGHAPGDAKGVWVARQNGQLYRLAGGRRTLRLSISGRTRAEGERGLLGVAFHPTYARTRLVVLSSTNRAGDSRVELWRLGASPKRARLVRTLLSQRQPFANHNGGHVTFGAGNTLYLGLGDGGGGNDPLRAGQSTATRLGKILRATVAPTGRSSWTPVARGVRNPWRFWFDGERNELWVGDVGQNAFEEVSRVPLDGSSTPNLGWGPFEGGRRNPAGGDTLSGGTLIWPVITYAQGENGCSITGGEIYSGSGIPALRGRYVYGDFCSGRLWSTEPAGVGVGPIRRESATIPQLTSFGSDAAGELYATSGGGTVYRLVR